MQIAVHDDQTTERVGTLDIDEVSGAVRYLEGPVIPTSATTPGGRPDGTSPPRKRTRLIHDTRVSSRGARPCAARANSASVQVRPSSGSRLMCTRVPELSRLPESPPAWPPSRAPRRSRLRFSPSHPLGPLGSVPPGPWPGAPGYPPGRG